LDTVSTGAPRAQSHDLIYRRSQFGQQGDTAAIPTYCSR